MELRNATEKAGITLVAFGATVIVRMYADGRIGAVLGIPEVAIAGHSIPSPLISFECALKAIRDLVEEAHERGFVPIPDNKRASGTFEFVRECTPRQPSVVGFTHCPVATASR